MHTRSMAAKVALAVLIGIGLSIVSIASAHAVSSGWSAPAVAGMPLLADCSGSAAGGRIDCAGHGCSASAPGGQLAWSAASWLVGLGLVVSIGRRGQPQPTQWP
jgi:hypothetical protein